GDRRSGFRYGCGEVHFLQVPDSGSMDSPMLQAIEKKHIKEQPDADVVIMKDAFGDGRRVRLACFWHYL
ncbi:unnamed protein product, partial [Musa acuminata subsp. burmannicoides]